jgi:excisionase family DNA binding protein
MESYNPFEALQAKLNNIESLLLDIKHKETPIESKKYSVATLAEYAGVSELSIRNWITEGKIEAKRIGRRILIDSKQFEDGLHSVKSLKYKR